MNDKVWRVTAATASTFDLDAPFAAGSGGDWYGACTPMRDTRCDLPDLSRDDVREIFLSDWSRHVERAFARHGARHLWIDENAALYKLSAVDANPQFTPIDGTTERTLLRLGRQKAIARKYGRRVMANISWNATKDAMSPAQRRLLRQSVDGMASEGACQIFHRSYYQMIGPDGYLENLEWLLARGFLYHYIPQPLGGPPTAFAIDGTNGSQSGGGTPTARTVIQLTGSVDGQMYPTLAQSTATDPHNLSGQVFGIYGHSSNGRNGVHRHRRCTGYPPYLSETESPWDGGSVGAGGKIVHAHFARIMKTVGLTQGAGGKVRVTTEFPHLIFPNGAAPLPGPTAVYLYGYTSNGLVDGGFYAVSYVSATAFDLDGATWSADDAAAGIAFDVHSDERYFAGLAMLLWRPGRLIVLDEGSLSYVRDWKNWILGTKPDGPYTVTSFDGTATGGSTTTLTNSGAGFTDAVLGEALLMTSGPNANAFSRVIARTASQLTVSPAFAAAIANGHTYIVGKTATTDPTKVLEIKRYFNSGAKSIAVWPQKAASVASGF